MVSEPTALQMLILDLEAERGALDVIVADLDEHGWDLSTPAQWTVKDQIGHLAFFDDVATQAITDPDAFAMLVAAALSSAGDPMEEHLRRGRAMSGRDVLAWWRHARETSAAALRTVPPGRRIAWFGPDMGALSFVSARLMETWAHGQDIADALTVSVPPTDRLRHVAHLGVKARPFSYVVRGLDPPAPAVAVELDGPSGQTWRWDEGAPGGSVQGSALDFCLVVTQRRHLDDTTLVVVGESARQWMSIAQAFAGAPGPGRPPLPGAAHRSER